MREPSSPSRRRERSGSGGEFWGWVVVPEAIWVGGLAFAVADRNAELGGRFDGEERMEEIEGPLDSARSTSPDVTPERLVEIFATYHGDWHQVRFRHFRSFLAGIKSGGASLMLWRDGVATETAAFQKKADEAAGRFEEIRKSMKVTDPVWSKAIEIAAGASGATWSRDELKEAQDATAELKGKRDQVASTDSAIQRAYEYAVKDEAEKPGKLLRDDEQATLKSWSLAVSTYGVVQKTCTQPVREWAKLLEAAYDADVRAWEAMQKAFEPVKKGEIRASSPCKDCPWDSKLKSAGAEAAKIKAEHKARRKALGIPPEDRAD